MIEILTLFSFHTNIQAKSCKNEEFSVCFCLRSLIPNTQKTVELFDLIFCMST